MSLSTQRERRYKDEKMNCAVKELDKYRKRQRDIIFCSQKLIEYRENFYIGAQDYERLRVSGGKNIDEVAELGVKWAELETEIHKLKSEAKKDMLIIEIKLNNLSYMERKVIELYYLEGYTIEKVAQSMNFSEAWVRKIKYKALKKYADSESVSLRYL